MPAPLSAAGTLIGQTAGAAQSIGVFSPITTSVGYGVNQQFPVQLPNPEEALQAYIAGNLSREFLNIIWSCHGRTLNIPPRTFSEVKEGHLGVAEFRPEYLDQSLTPWQAVARNIQYTPSIPETLYYLNRGIIEYPLAYQWIKRLVGRQTALADLILTTRHEIPGPSDLVRFAVREAFTPEIVQLYGYHKETPVNIKPWMDKQGFGGTIDVQIPPGATDQEGRPIQGPATWFDCYWWSHWELPSNTQGYEMLHRLYPVSRYGPSPDIVNGASFNDADHDKMMKANDIPEYWRVRLRAISYHPLTRTDTFYLYEQGMIVAADVYHALRADGYNDRDASLLTLLAGRREEKKLGIDPRKVSKDFVCSHYKIGSITRARGLQLLTEHGYYTAVQAGQFLDVCEIEIRSETLRHRLKQIRISYLTGAYDDNELLELLQQIGINPHMTDQYYDRWRHERYARYKPASVRYLSKAFMENSITEQELERRLFNLHYMPNAVTLIINNLRGEKQRKLNNQLNQRLKETIKANQARAKQIEKVQRETRKQQVANQKLQDNIAKKRMRGIVKASTDENLVKWYAMDLIEAWEILYNLYYRDYTVKNAVRWLKSNIEGITNEEIDNAAKKAQKIYLGEGNPPVPTS